MSKLQNFFDTVENITPRGILSHFDKDEDEKLNLNEFKSMLKELFSDFETAATEGDIASLFTHFDVNKNRFIELSELETAFKNWIHPMLNPVSAILVVDVQNDFITGTLSLKNCPAKQDPEEVVPAINKLLDEVPFNVVVYTYDWHPKNHISFFENVCRRKMHDLNKTPVDNVKLMDTVLFEDPDSKEPVEQILWPTHCVQNSWGSELHKNLVIKEDSIKIYKGTNPGVDSYSAFWDNSKKSGTELKDKLIEKNVTDVFACGLAWDYCVGSTALHALEHGFKTAMINDACRGVSEEGIKEMRGKIESQGGGVVESKDVKDMVLGKRRLFKMALKAVDL